MIFKLTDAIFVGGDHTRRFGFDETVKELLDLFFGFRQIGFKHFRARLTLCDAQIPLPLQHTARGAQDALRRLELAQQHLEFGFDLVSAD